MNNQQLKLCLSKTIQSIYEKHGHEAIMTKKFHIGCFEFKYLVNKYYGIINLLKAPIKVCHSDGSYTLVDSRYAVIDKKPETFLLLTINNGKIKEHSNGENSHYKIEERVIEYKNIADKMYPSLNFNSDKFTPSNPNYLYKFNIAELLSKYRIQQTGDRVIIIDHDSNPCNRYIISRSLLEGDYIYTNEYNSNNMRISSLKDSAKKEKETVDLKSKKEDIISIVSSGIEKLDETQLEKIKKYAFNLLNNIHNQ